MKFSVFAIFFFLLIVIRVDTELGKRTTNVGINRVVVEHDIAVIVQILDAGINDMRCKLRIGNVENLAQSERNLLLDKLSQRVYLIGALFIERSTTEQIRSTFAVPLIEPVPDVIARGSNVKINEVVLIIHRQVQKRGFDFLGFRVHGNVLELLPQQFKNGIALAQGFHSVLHKGSSLSYGSQRIFEAKADDDGSIDIFDLVLGELVNVITNARLGNGVDLLAQGD